MTEITKTLYDHNSRVLKVLRVQDIESHIEEVKQAKLDNPKGTSKSKVWRRIGSIPCIVVDKWLSEGFNPFENSPEARRELRRRLNEFSKFRTVDKAL